MFRTLLTPLRAAFDSPRTAAFTDSNHGLMDEEVAPEDFARDVMVELMRNSVEHLKLAEDAKSRQLALAEIQKIMMKDTHTKHVFRELDGFLILMSLLSNALPYSGSNSDVPDHVIADALELVRLIFVNLAEATSENLENCEYFQDIVGYESFSHALRGLTSNQKTADQTLGLIFSFAMQDFDISDVFSSLQNAAEDDVDATLAGFESRLGTIRRPDAMRIIWDFIPALTTENGTKRYVMFKLFEALSHVSHRNHAVLSSLGLLKSAFHHFCITRNDPIVPEKERHVLQKFLRRLLDMGATTSVTRSIFQKTLKDDQTLDTEILDTLRFGIKSRWMEHFSMESQAALIMTEDGMRGMPPSGFTFMAWIWISSSIESTHAIFTVKSSSKAWLSLGICPDGTLELSYPCISHSATFSKVKIHKLRWVHVALVHHPNRSSNPTVRLFIDGALNEAMTWGYPKSEKIPETGVYIIGDVSKTAKMSWCIASAYFIRTPLDDFVLRFIYHLGARYSGNFQDPALVKFLTYDASTSLNMYLITTASKHPNSNPRSLLMNIIKEGLNIPKESIFFALTPASARQFRKKESVLSDPISHQFHIEGDVFIVKAAPVDSALWKIGGAAVALQLVQAARTPHELSRALGVLCDGLKNNWQNSEDMERLRGYEILADILRAKGQMINISSFEVLFEFLGLSFRSPEQSLIVNPTAYKAIALDFECWSRARKEIQQVFFEHFITLLQTSRHRKFNSQQRLGKMCLVRKLLFVLQMNWFETEVIKSVVDVLQAAARAYFIKDDTIKPIVTFLAANLHEDSYSPCSASSHFDYEHFQKKPEQVLEMFISILSVQPLYMKFTTALPVPRICLLLLGDKPTPNVAVQILNLVGISNVFSSSFARRFELVSGWSVFKTVLPYCWSSEVRKAAFDVLLGRKTITKESPTVPSGVVTCPNMVPVIFSAMSTALLALDDDCRESFSAMSSPSGKWLEMEKLVEDLIELHASSATFRQVFQSQQTTQLLVDAYKSFVTRVKEEVDVDDQKRRILDKLTHFSLAVATNSIVAGPQKHEILISVQSAHQVLNPGMETPKLNPTLLADMRSVRQRIASARFSMHVEERTVLKTITRLSEWRKTIQASERKRLRKTILDLRETRRQISCLHGWSDLLTAERGLWPSQGKRLWKLDETEGPYRIRKRLEPINGNTYSSQIHGTENNSRTVRLPEDDSASMQHIEVPPWIESYEISATESDDKQLAEDIVDDKHRRVRHELEPGDVIEAVGTIARIAGIDSSPGLLIIGKTHLYMLDGLVESDDNEVIAAQDAPKRLFFVPGSIVELGGPRRAQRWPHEQISACSERTCLFRDVALEIYFRDSRSLLIVFLDKKKCADMNLRIATIITSHSASGLGHTPGILKTPVLGRISARVLLGLRPDELLTAQRKWQAREISNFSYISILNQISGRTPSDATQYPVFPWVLNDYSSQTLDIHDPLSYRDLTKPMGALTSARREAANTRYENLSSVGEVPFHYGTHFSSSMIVCHFLIRMAPFTNMFKTLQGGDWDLPDRLFCNLERAYESASNDIRGDVRELLPEFFTFPEFLENSANLDFGVQQNSGERIHDVKLPPWARQDPLLFIVMNRRALESDHVSRQLPAWIDLIWGYKQRDPACSNVFHPLSYEGTIDLDTITDELEREATVGIIHNFGQTPRKLFHVPHPKRFKDGTSSLPLGVMHGIEEDPHLLVQEIRCFKDLGPTTPVRELCFDMVGEKIIPCPTGVLCMPSHPHKQIGWHPRGADLRVVVDNKVVQVVENAFCNCATFADSNNLVTGSSDFTVRLWKVEGGSSGTTRVVLSHIMRIHTEEVLSVTASRTWSLVVSGSKDGSAALWDLNRGMYVRSIWHGEQDMLNAVNLVAINESTGYIATCSQQKLCLHTVNARPIATLDLTAVASYAPYISSITTMAFHEREYSRLGILATGSSDGSIVLRTWSADGTPEGEKAQWEFLTIRTMKARASGDSIRSPGVTCLKFLGESLVHGEETGRSYFWCLSDT